MDHLTEVLRPVSKRETPPLSQALAVIFQQNIVPANLREKFLCATFEIVGEQGADALSASELIKRTLSSKGALFHHFQTIDQLCLESLSFFKKFLAGSLGAEQSQTLAEYLEFFEKDTMKRFGNTYYVHIAHFFRDRAIRDERYREAFQDFLNGYIETISQRVLNFLPAGTDIEIVKKKILFMVMMFERVCYQRVLYNDPTAGQAELSEFRDFVRASLEKIAG